MSDPYRVVKQFEAALCDYTGAPYAVAVNSCTMALLLACRWFIKDATARGRREELPGDEGRIYPVYENRMSQTRIALGRRCDVEIPRRTYVSVPMSIIHAGGRPTFRDEEWSGAYQLKPLPVWDSARRFWSGMYWAKFDGTPHIECVSFHASKILGDTQGGAILHADPAADIWLRKARFDGRTEGIAPIDDIFDVIGWHCMMTPDVAARLLVKLQFLPKINYDLPNSNYPDLSQMAIFR